MDTPRSSMALAFRGTRFAFVLPICSTNALWGGIVVRNLLSLYALGSLEPCLCVYAACMGGKAGSRLTHHIWFFMRNRPVSPVSNSWAVPTHRCGLVEPV